MELFGTTGQERRQWLDQKADGFANMLSYYLGPTGIPERLGAGANLLAYTDAGDMVEAADASRSLWNDPSLANAARYATAGTALAIPFVGAKSANLLGDAVSSGADDISDFLRQEDGMFGGIFARTADKDALAQAQEMTARGVSRDDVWRDTGWFRGVDGEWRFEINDRGAYPFNDLSSGGAAASDYIAHDDLFAAYPDMRDTYFSRLPTMEARGHYVETDDLIRINHGDNRSTALHELQHAVQAREGFARGGAPSRSEPEEVDWSSISPVLDRYRIEGAGMGETALDALDRMRAELMRAGAPFSEIGKLDAERRRFSDMYRKIAGEVEARNVESRMNMTPNQRRATPPWATQDVPDDQQIIRGLLRQYGVE
jgi:hypothetical protein